MANNITITNATNTSATLKQLLDTIWSHHYDANGQVYDNSNDLFVALSACNVFFITYAILMIIVFFLFFFHDRLCLMIPAFWMWRPQRQRRWDEEAVVELMQWDRQAHARQK